MIQTNQVASCFNHQVDGEELKSSKNVTLFLLGDMFSPAKWCQQVEAKDGHLPTNKWWAHLFKIYVAI